MHISIPGIPGLLLKPYPISVQIDRTLTRHEKVDIDIVIPLGIHVPCNRGDKADDIDRTAGTGKPTLTGRGTFVEFIGAVARKRVGIKEFISVDGDAG